MKIIWVTKIWRFVVSDVEKNQDIRRENVYLLELCCCRIWILVVSYAAKSCDAENITVGCQRCWKIWMLEKEKTHAYSFEENYQCQSCEAEKKNKKLLFFRVSGVEMYEC